jgi:glycosyltransferase involved in cell wall biosynthesis
MERTGPGYNEKMPKLTLLIFYQYFSTNKGSYGTRLYEFSKYWVQKGYNVKVVTSVYYKSDLKKLQSKKRYLVDGIDVIVLNIPVSNKDHLVKRIYHFVKYSLFSIRHALTENCDIVLASSGPISAGIPALIAKKFRKKPFIFEVRDLWPGVVEEIGIIKNKLVLNLAYRFEKYCYQNAEEVVALSPGMEKNINDRFPTVTTSCIYNTANPDIFTRSNYHGQSEKNILYTGNIGLVNNSVLLIKTAHLLKERNRDDITITIIGDGQLKDLLLLLKRKLNLDNLVILNSMPKERLIEHLQSAAASVIPLMDRPILNTSSPNKLYESLMAGIPIIQTTKGWISDLIEETKSGINVSPKNPDEMVEAILKLVDDDDLRMQMATNAQRLALERFTTNTQASLYITIFNRLDQSA